MNRKKKEKEKQLEEAKKLELQVTAPVVEGDEQTNNVVGGES
jgi:hypothetical protein